MASYIHKTAGHSFVFSLYLGMLVSYLSSGFLQLENMCFEGKDSSMSGPFLYPGNKICHLSPGFECGLSQCHVRPVHIYPL